jgi:hypothetical protein
MSTIPSGIRHEYHEAARRCENIQRVGIKGMTALDLSDTQRCVRLFLDALFAADGQDWSF